MSKQEKTGFSVVSAKDQRSHPRFSTDLKVRLYWQDDIGNLFDAPASVKTVSEQGFGVEVDMGLGIGRLVTVKTPRGTSIYCVVRHRQSGPNGITIGLEALPSSDGKGHLLVLERLSAALKKAAGEV